MNDLLNLEALSDGRIGSGAKVGEYPMLRPEAKKALAYEIFTDRIRFFGCLTGDCPHSNVGDCAGAIYREFQSAEKELMEVIQ